MMKTNKFHTNWFFSTNHNSSARNLKTQWYTSNYPDFKLRQCFKIFFLPPSFFLTAILNKPLYFRTARCLLPSHVKFPNPRGAKPPPDISRTDANVSIIHLKESSNETTRPAIVWNIPNIIFKAVTKILSEN